MKLTPQVLAARSSVSARGTKSSDRQAAAALDEMDLPELGYFREHFLPSYRLTLDELE